MNILGSVYPTQVLLPAMMERKEGRIVFVSSQAGQVELTIYTKLAVALLYMIPDFIGKKWEVG